MFCHDALQGEVRHCPACEAGWHPDCGAEARRCPTIGCAGPPPDREVRRGTRRRRVEDGAAETPVRPHRLPSALARLGPYGRLVASGVASVIGFLLSLLLITGALLLFLFALGMVHGPAALLLLLPVLAICLGLGFAGYLGVHATGEWLRDLPSVFGEVRWLLEETAPVAMRFRLDSRQRDRGAPLEYFVRLRRPDRGDAFHDHTIPLGGVLPPAWLRWQEETQVLVYGLRDGGPCILEFPDGWLALLHPD